MDNIFQKFQTYIENRIDLVKLDIEHKIKTLVIKLMLIMTLILAALLFLLFISLGLALFLNQLMCSSFIGFIFVAVFYLMLGIIIYIYLRKKEITIFKDFK